MKVSASLRKAFEDQREVCLRLKEKVDQIVHGFKEGRWHYESRLKELNSFTLKVESGRFSNPAALEDFFACTIVVANYSDVDRAKGKIFEKFDLKYRRPKDDGITHKRPDSFPFDDLRLYVTLKEDPALPETGLEGVIFEFQVKTFLQHAWSIATHDLVYKTDDINWSKERIAYQVRAMLEHAELSIYEASSLSRSSVLNLQDYNSQKIRGVVDLLKNEWDSDQLPSDMLRLARNVYELMRGIDIDLARISEVARLGRERYGGHPDNLSPFGAFVQYLFFFEKDRMAQALAKVQKGGGIFVPHEVEIPSDLDQSAFRSMVKPS
ncbi:MAG: hypothetical protein KAG82_06005 [Alcanivoracaceae bacterium]|nr:hypothetical protein [Alcanivoracaceae bacterium]